MLRMVIRWAEMSGQKKRADIDPTQRAEKRSLVCQGNAARIPEMVVAFVSIAGLFV